MLGKTSRRGRRATALGLAGVVFALSSAAEAAPKWLRLSFTGDTSTSMSVTWNTDVVEGTEVHYGTTPGSLTETVTGTSFQANSSLGHVHEVTLANLLPNTTYHYVAGSTNGGFSAEQEFKTGPAQSDTCGSFKFVFLGDNRPDPIFGGGENWPEILGQSSVHQPAFALNGGDLVIDGEEIDEWKSLLGWTETVASTVPFMPCIGNHDNGPGEGDGANYNQLFSLPRSTGTNGSGTEDYYYFTYGNAVFVALSTDTFSAGTPKFADQAAWLDEVLTNNPRKWKFVYYHKPTYSHEAFFSISHAPNEAGQNEAFVSIIDKHHVDVVFTSHNHWYERFEPSACGTQGNPGSTTACSVGANNFAQGTIYYVTGGAGAFTIPALLCGSETGRASCSGDHHYLLVDIKDETMKIETWGAFPQNNQVIDSVTVTKSADVCVDPPDAGPDAAAEAGPDAAAEAGPDGAADSSPPDAAPPPDAGTPDTGSTSDAGGSGGGSSDAGHVSNPSVATSSDDGGCGCRTTATGTGKGTFALLVLAFGALIRRRRGQ